MLAFDTGRRRRMIDWQVGREAFDDWVIPAASPGCLTDAADHLSCD